MITKKDAIAIGTAICKAVKRETENLTEYTINGVAKYSQEDGKRIYSARGTGIYALDNLWYDVIPNKVKFPYGQGNLSVYTKDDFYKDCGWPE